MKQVYEITEPDAFGYRNETKSIVFADSEEQALTVYSHIDTVYNYTKAKRHTYSVMKFKDIVGDSGQEYMGSTLKPYTTEKYLDELQEKISKLQQQLKQLKLQL